MVQSGTTTVTRLGRVLLTSKLAQLGEIAVVFFVALVVISSIVFGLIHSEWAVAGMVQTGFMGLALAVSYVAVGRNLWITILAHGYADTLLLVQLYFAER